MNGSAIAAGRRRARRSGFLRRAAAGCSGRVMTLDPLEMRSLFSGTVSGSVINDANNDGLRNNGESGLTGWTVYADLNNDGVLTAGEPSDTTSGGGGYTLRNVPAGSVTVREVLQSGWAASTGNSPSRVATVQNNQTTANVNFLNFRAPQGTVTGVVWKDINGDGIRDAADPGMAGVTVFDDANNNGLLETGEKLAVTDSTGRYTLAGVAAGDRNIAEVLPVGYTTSRGFGTTQRVRVADGATVAARDFSNISTTEGVIQGTVWNDLNADSIRAVDPVTGVFSEPGLAGWTVFLDANADRVLQPGEVSTVTDASGGYQFAGLSPGNYDVVEVLPAGWNTSPLFGLRNTVRVTAGGISTGNDFANFANINGSISGTAWNDQNLDGVRQAGEPGLSGWQVFLDLNGNGARDDAEPATSTDAIGAYSFANLQAGHYTVVEVVQAGWEVTPGHQASYEVTVDSAANTVAPDFANGLIPPPPPATIQGQVWEDVNGNTVRDPGEPGLAGWTVFIDSNGNGLLDAAEPQSVTDAGGNYSIGGLSPGTVSLRLVMQSNFHSSNPVTSVQTIFVAPSAVIDRPWGVAQTREASISGTVFNDANKNGLRDAGEKGLAGLTVFLDSNNNGLLDAGEPTTTTSADLFFTPTVDETGTYAFTHLPAGSYTVRVILPATLGPTPAAQAVHTMTLTSTQVSTGVDTAARYRLNEIHGTTWSDTNGNHLQDPGEPVTPGTDVYIDTNRNGAYDAGEPATTSGPDGSYAFYGLTPGTYVVSERHRSGQAYTYPTTTGGILWPAGTSNPAVGNVTPTSIQTSLATGETYNQHVSLTLPGTGSLSNLVDVFLLFDDTGSFVGNSPIVRAAFPAIMSQLQAALPGTDFGFGVGRFEEYANFALENATGRPFILNQPIVSASTPGYQAAIQAGLNRTTPGYGGDQPETDIEALYQLVTGLGFDGNSNGTVSDSGPAGLASTQLTPGLSGDVPAFASFTADAANGVLAPSGNIGGGGFRAGALPIVLLATDTGFAYQPKGETSITGVGGLTLPLSQLTGTSRPTTPFGHGAGIQETVTGLNALGALVIGLGTNAQLNVDPRQQLSALSMLTGAVNHTGSTILNGTPNPIAPGDPLYFQIATGFADSVSGGVVSAIQNAATSVAYDITVRASDPRVKITNFTGTVTGVGAGQTAGFDVQFTGDGAPHRFDLQFVRNGTGVVLGSIPVVLGTPIAGDNYQYVEMDEGDVADNKSFGSRAAAVLPSVVGRFFLNSDGVSVATDKQALLPGQTATFANYTNGSQGLGAVLVDVAGVPTQLTLADLDLKVGTSSDPGSWAAAPAPLSLTRLPGGGVGGSDRYLIRFADGAIRNQWLSVVTLANANSGLPAPDTFYFGSAPGDVNVGNTAGKAVVNATDAAEIRKHFSAAVVAGTPWDVTGDGKVDNADVVYTLGHTTTLANALPLWTAPATPVVAPALALTLAPAAAPAIAPVADPVLAPTAAPAVDPAIAAAPLPDLASAAVAVAAPVVAPTIDPAAVMTVDPIAVATVPLDPAPAAVPGVDPAAAPALLTASGTLAPAMPVLRTAAVFSRTPVSTTPPASAEDHASDLVHTRKPRHPRHRRHHHKSAFA